MYLPDEERMKFEQLIGVAASAYGFGAGDYLRKIWYHEQASVLGEYVALALVEKLVGLSPVCANDIDNYAEATP